MGWVVRADVVSWMWMTLCLWMVDLNGESDEMLRARKRKRERMLK